MGNRAALDTRAVLAVDDGYLLAMCQGRSLTVLDFEATRFAQAFSERLLPYIAAVEPLMRANQKIILYRP
jgi:hypothetical protein